jgi:hypothetical protein
MNIFSKNQVKLDYTNLLISCSIKSKAILTAHCLESKVAEYAVLKSALGKHTNGLRRSEEKAKKRG